MRKLISWSVCLLTFYVGSTAQTTDTFDIATFQAPAGWKKLVKEGVVIFNTTDAQKGTYAMLMLYPSGTSSGNAKGDFDSDWQEFIAGQLGVKGKPQIEPATNADGWSVVTGGTGFENEMGTSAVLLSTYSGYGKKYSMAAMFNSQDNLSAIEAFVSSVKLKKPETNSQPVPANNDVTALVGVWGMTSSDQSSFAVNQGINGYITRQYTFNPNGTYEFLGKLFAYTSRELLFTKETGTYQLNGNSLTISPQRSIIQAYTKATVIGTNGRPAETDNWGKLVSTQNRLIEKVTYQISKVYMSGTEKWQLRLEPGKATGRDGPFNGGSSYPNTWFYETQRFPIEPPR
jgi:hypothetical protein